MMVIHTIQTDHIGDNIARVRERNRATILQLVLKHSPISRRDIVKATGLTAAAVSDITRELINDGFVKELSLKPSRQKKSGRVPIQLAIDKESRWVVGILVSRQKVQLSIGNLVGELVFTKSTNTACSSVERTQESILELTEEAIAYASTTGPPILGIGLSIPGMVVASRGVVRYSSILGWQDVQLVQRLQQKLPFPIAIDNDVRGMALAEYWFGSQFHRNFIVVYIGNGVGSCLIQSGQVLAGYSGAAGQLGHTIVDPNGPMCSCGQRGCLEAIVSTDRILENVANQLQAGGISSISLSKVANGEILVSDVSAFAEYGDEVARAVLRKMAWYLGLGLSNLIKIYDPEALILLGDIFSGGEYVSNLVRREIYARLLKQQHCPTILVDRKANKPLLGSVAIALDQFVYRSPSIETRLV